MNFIDSLIDFFKKSPTYSEGEAPDGYCPNCWGSQEYGLKFYEIAKNYDVDINSTNPNIGWVRDYANKHLSGIQLKKKDEVLICQKCKLTYRPEK